jgi:virulence-associated protein VagC
VGNIDMKALVESDGVRIPKRMLKGVTQVEIRKQRNVIIVEPTAMSDDPIFRLGKKPVRTKARDGSTRHDDYLYRKP